MDDGGVRHTGTHGILTGDEGARIYVKRQNRRDGRAAWLCLLVCNSH